MRPRCTKCRMKTYRFSFNQDSLGARTVVLLAAEQSVRPVVGLMAHMSFAILSGLFLLSSICPYANATTNQRTLPQTFSQMQSGAVNYADVRTRVAHAFAEKAHEMSAVIGVLQTLSKETAALTETIQTHCGVKMGAVRRNALRG